MMENRDPAPDQSLAPILDLIEQKRKKHGEKYDRFLAAVGGLLRTEFPDAFEKMPDKQLIDLISFVDIVGGESQGMMRRLKDACAACGWCCSETVGIIVSAGDAARISRELKRKKDELFVEKDGVWRIKNAHPCQWWNVRNGRCQIYNIRPQTCRAWPSLPNEKGVCCLQPVAECAYAVRVAAIKVLGSLRSSQKAANI